MFKHIDIVFGSASDAWFYEPLAARINEIPGLAAKTWVWSAHRNIMELKPFVEGLAGQLIVAGAGLSAALPGVMAAASQIPVIGVPVDKGMEPDRGIDAFFSMVCVPKGTPVLTTAINGAEAVLTLIRAIHSGAPLETFIRTLPSRADLMAFFRAAQSEPLFLGINYAENWNVWKERLAKATG